MNRKFLSRLGVVGFLFVLATPGVVANVSVNDDTPTPNVNHPFDELTASTGTLVVRTSDTNDAVKVGLGTTAPGARLHVQDLGLATANQGAVQVNYGNAGASITTYGVKVDATGFSDKGTEIGVQASADKIGGSDPQRGAAVGRLAQAGGFHANGHVLGVYGASTPAALSNFDSTMTSTGMGGSFAANPTALTLNGVGTYWVGGVLGQATGVVNGSAGKGAVAGVIGVAATTGTAKTYAGYFQGDVKSTADVSGLSVTYGAGVPTACGAATRGVTQLVQGGAGVADVLQMCMKSAANTYSWRTIVVG